jgi:predicted CoA-binding protein
MWYVHHNLPVTPINPTTPHIAHSTYPVTAASTPTVPSVRALPNPTSTSLSVVTPPAATLTLLRDAWHAGVPAVWLQPGTYDESVLEFARADGRFAAVVAGEDERSAGDEGWCVLMDGNRGLSEVGKL